MKFKKGTIVVATKHEATGCGIVYVKANSILKMAVDTTQEDENDEYGNRYTGVYRNAKEERSNNSKTIEVEKLRMATEEETKCWGNGIYYVTPSTEKSEVA